MQKKYEELPEHEKWPDRVATINDAFKKKQAKKIIDNGVKKEGL